MGLVLLVVGSQGIHNEVDAKLDRFSALRGSPWLNLHEIPSISRTSQRTRQVVSAVDNAGGLPKTHTLQPAMVGQAAFWTADQEKRPIQGVI